MLRKRESDFFLCGTESERAPLIFSIGCFVVAVILTVIQFKRMKDVRKRKTMHERKKMMMKKKKTQHIRGCNQLQITSKHHTYCISQCKLFADYAMHVFSSLFLSLSFCLDYVQCKHND